MNKTWMAAFFAVALMTVAGCGGGGGNSTNPINRQESPVPTSTQTTTGTYRGIEYSLIVPVQTKPDEFITMKFTATNRRGAPITYDDGHGYNTRMVVRQNNIIVFDSDGLLSTGVIPPTIQLDANKSLVLPASWHQTDTGGNKVAPGTYSVQMFFVPTDDKPPITNGQRLADSEVFKYGAPPVDVVVTP